MKLLLTSSGISKKSIADALETLVGKSVSSTKIAFIPTAANGEPGNKDWYINQLLHLWRFGFRWVDIVDPAADGVEWRSRLSQADVILVSGGNTFYLLEQARKSGFLDWLQENLDTKVYVGISAGSILATPTVEIAALPPGDENSNNLTDLRSLGWVKFEIEPHCDEARLDVVSRYAESKSHPVYGIDDQSAIMVHGSDISVISEGFWRIYNS